MSIVPIIILAAVCAAIGYFLGQTVLIIGITKNLMDGMDLTMKDDEAIWRVRND